MHLKHWKILTFILLTAFLSVSTYLFLKGQHTDLSYPIDTNKFNDYGSFIGGLFGSLSIYLLLITYFYSIQGNELTKIETFYQNLNSEINDASFEGEKGTDAYLAYDMNTQTKNVILDNLNVVVTSFATYLNYVSQNKIVSESDKKIYVTRIYLLFYSKVLWPLHETITKNGISFINKKHDDSLLVLPKFCDIGIKTIKYLRENEIAAASAFKDETIKKLRIIIDSAQHGDSSQTRHSIIG